MSDISKLPKWAQAKFAELQEERDLLAAFHRTQPVEPDIDFPKSGDNNVQGFTFNAYTLSVLFSVSNSVAHGSNHMDMGPCKRTTSRGSIRQYTSAQRAAQAMRYVVELECARRLAAIDKLIEKHAFRLR
jgi:hypothetical protein